MHLGTTTAASGAPAPLPIDSTSVMLAALRQCRAALDKCQHVPGITEQAIWAADDAIAAGSTRRTLSVVLSPVERQQAIENALSMALFHVRSDKPEALQQALAKANRATTLLKHARQCSDGGRA